MTGASDAAREAPTRRPVPGAGKGDGLCLNCGTARRGEFCHRCGQAGHLHRSLSGIWHDIAHGVLHFEGRLWNTLPLLAWRPGELTRRYIHGERARFVSPMALFLFSVFLMFACFSALGAKLQVDGTLFEMRPSGQAEMAHDLAALDRQIAAARAANRPTEELERERAMIGAIVDAAARPGDGAAFRTGIAVIDKAIAKANANPNLLLYKIQSNAYKFSWLLIPISTPFLWLMFAWHRRYRVYDHAVFVTYSLAFMTLFVIALTLGAGIGLPEAVIGAAVLLVPPLHMYRQMRGAYRLGRANAALRTLLLVTVALCCLGSFGALLLGAGALG